MVLVGRDNIEVANDEAVGEVEPPTRFASLLRRESQKQVVVDARKGVPLPQSFVTDSSRERSLVITVVR